jgi:hypothetical protein
MQAARPSNIKIADISDSNADSSSRVSRSQKARNELASPTHAVSSLPQSNISNGAKPSNSIATHGFQQVIRRRRGR